MYASAVAWTFKPGTADHVRRVHVNMVVPALNEQPGFRHFYSARVWVDTWLTVMVFDTKAHQDAALAILNPLLRLYHGRIIVGIQRYAGEVEIEEVATV